MFDEDHEMDDNNIETGNMLENNKMPKRCHNLKY